MEHVDQTVRIQDHDRRAVLELFWVKNLPALSRNIGEHHHPSTILFGQRLQDRPVSCAAMVAIRLTAMVTINSLRSYCTCWLPRIVISSLAIQRYHDDHHDNYPRTSTKCSETMIRSPCSVSRAIVSKYSSLRSGNLSGMAAAFVKFRVSHWMPRLRTWAMNGSIAWVLSKS